MPAVVESYIRAGISVLLGGVIAVASPAGEPSADSLLRVTVDGREVPVPAGDAGIPAALGIPSGTLAIRLGTHGEAGRPVDRRFRYRMEGRDAEWRESTTAMRLVVVFLDSTGDWLAEAPFPVQGESPGWDGSPATSPLVARRERIAVPAGADSFSVRLTSAGPPAAVGTLAVGALAVSRVDAAGAVLPPLLDLAPAALESAEAAPPGATNAWIRSGTRPSMARIVPSPGTPSGRLLALVDEDAQSHAEWQGPRVPLDAGTDAALEIEWRQAFSIGLAEVPTAVYPRLRPGTYVLRVQELSLAGRSAGVERSIPVTVAPPFWQRPGVLVLCGMAFAALALGAARAASARRMRREMDRLRQENAVEAERARIARDIHDDLGAALTHISMLSQPLPRDNADSAGVSETLARINGAVRQMTQSMDEIVWAVNPQNDRLDRFVAYIDAYAQDYLATAGIVFRCAYPEPLPSLPLKAPVRHHLFLAFKEALTNAVRHAECRTVRIALAAPGGRIALTVCDDGKGFDATPGRPSGNGLANMRRRLESVGGRCVVESAPGRGTGVRFEVPSGE
jgi:signal transduction histidine kinase